MKLNASISKIELNTVNRFAELHSGLSYATLIDNDDQKSHTSLRDGNSVGSRT